MLSNLKIRYAVACHIGRLVIHQSARESPHWQHTDWPTSIPRFQSLYLYEYEYTISRLVAVVLYSSRSE